MNNSPDKNSIEIAVLNQLFVAQSMFHVFPDETKLGGFVTDSLLSVPGIEKCFFVSRNCQLEHSTQLLDINLIKKRLKNFSDGQDRFLIDLPDDKSRVSLPLQTRERIYGYVFLIIRDHVRFTCYKSVVGNFLNVVSIELENRWQKALNVKYSAHLEEKVNERTVELQREILGRKQAEGEIKRNAAKWQSTFDAMSDSVCILNMDGLINQYNYATLTLLGIKSKDVKQKHCYQLVHGTSEYFPNCPFVRMKKSKQQESMTFQENDRWLEVSVDPIFDDKKELIGAVHVVSDITDRKKVEEQLKEQNSRYSTLLQNLDGMVYHCENDSNWTMNFVSDGCFELTGYKPESLIKNKEISFNELILPEYRNKVWDEFQSRLKRHKGIYIEYKIKTATGKVKWVLERGCGVYDENGELSHLEGFIFDITDRKKAEAVILENERLLNDVGEIAQIGGWEMDLKKGGKAKWTKGTYDIVEVKQDDPVPGLDEHLSWYMPEYRAMINGKMKDLVESKQTMRYEAELRTKSGKIKWCQAIGEAIEENGKVVKLRGTFQDITGRKQVEKALKKYTDRLRLLHKMDKFILAAESPQKTALSVLMDLIKIIPFKTASVTEFKVLDNTFNEIAVFPSGQIFKAINADLIDLSNEVLDLNQLQKGQEQTIKDLGKVKSNYLKAKDLIANGIRTIVLFPLISEGKLIGTLNFACEKIDGFASDQTEIAMEIADQLAVSIRQWRLREEISKHTEELEKTVIERTAQLECSNLELREFAQIVSHDLKAPLRAISQLSYWISEDYADKIDKDGQEKLKILADRVKRLDNLIEGILQYSRAGWQREKETLIDFQLLVEDSISMISPPDHIKIVFENQLPKYYGDATRFGQLFQNLIDNAIKFIDKPEGLVKIGCQKKSKFWQFHISDNGPGIEEKYYERIFLIFQRLVSRDVQEGTGIGLSLVKRIVKIYGGDIWLKSKLGQGTCFYFTLPLKTKSNKQK
jgi:PAS domain S-box-containing protein